MGGCQRRGVGDIGGGGVGESFIGLQAGDLKVPARDPGAKRREPPTDGVADAPRRASYDDRLILKLEFAGNGNALRSGPFSAAGRILRAICHT